MKIAEITTVIERFAPLALQESYDNSGLIVGQSGDEVRKALLAVDVTDAVLDEAEREGCDLIITHHPLVFHPLLRLNSANQVQRCVARAIHQGIALYACHTNLDSAPNGMSWRLATILGINQLFILQPRADNPATGFGVVGELPEALKTEVFLKQIQEKLTVPAIRHSAIVTDKVRRVAVCTGAGASLMEEVRAAKADLYVTADLKYNDFMIPDGAFTVADVGHFESEYCVIDILFEILSENLHTFAVRKSEDSCNPINYLI
ncbi:MAG: Nif3-like dinuclear metal center hexameric protein [Alistipes sp.]